MFKKKCSKCKNKVSKGYEFCPYCGNSFNSNENKYMFGKNNAEEDIFPSFFENTIMDKMFNSAMKMAEKMMEKQLKDFPEFNKQLKQNNLNKKIQPQISPDNNLEIQFFVNGKRVFPPNQAQEMHEIPELKPIKINNISKQKIEKFAKFPKKEPSSKLRRLSGKIIYEFDVPDVKNIEDVLINQLENSIEIKALGKDKVYSKTLNINLPILGYKLEQGNLILELKA